LENPPAVASETLDMDNLLRIVQATAANQQKMDSNQQNLTDQITALAMAVNELRGVAPAVRDEPLATGDRRDADGDEEAEQADAGGAHEQRPYRPRRDDRKCGTELVPALASIVDAAEKKYFSLQSRASSAGTAAAAQQLVSDKIVCTHPTAKLSKLPDGVVKSLRSIDPKMVGGPQGFAEMESFVKIQMKANDLTRNYQKAMTLLIVEHKKECVRVYEELKEGVSSGLSDRIAAALPETEVSSEVRSAQQALAVARLQDQIEFKNAERAAKAAEAQRVREENAAQKELAERSRLLSTDSQTVETLVHRAVANERQQQAAATSNAAASGGDATQAQDESLEALRSRRKSTDAIVRLASPAVTRSQADRSGNGDRATKAQGGAGSEKGPKKKRNGGSSSSSSSSGRPTSSRQSAKSPAKARGRQSATSPKKGRSAKSPAKKRAGK
jgi:hypothetical protein